MQRRTPRGGPFEKIFLKKDEIREIKENRLRVPVSTSGWPIHTYYAKYALLSVLTGFVVSGIVAFVAVMKDIPGPNIAIGVGVLGGFFVLLGLYFAIRETVLRVSLRRRGKVEDEIFWNAVLDRRRIQRNSD